MSSNRKQFRAIFLAAIMVISMVGMGFAGTVAATSPAEPDEDFDGFVAANPADADTDSADVVVTVNITDDDVTAQSADADEGGFVIEFEEDSDIDLSSVSNVDVERVTANGDTIDTIATDSANTIADFDVIGPDNNILRINEDNEAESNFAAGEQLRIVFDAADFQEPDGDSYNVNVGITDGDLIALSTPLDPSEFDTDSEQFTELGLELGGPISVDEVTGTDSEFYSLASALDEVDDNAEVTIDTSEFAFDTLDEYLTQPVTLQSDETVDDAQIADDKENVTIVGVDDPTLVSNANTVIDLVPGSSTQDDHTVEGISFDGDGHLGGVAQQAIAASDDQSGITVDQNHFENFDGNADPVVTLGGTETGTANLTVTDNSFDVGTTDVIDIEANFDDSDHFVDISNNIDIEFDGNNNGINTNIDGTEEGEVSIDNNEIFGDDGVGILLEGDHNVDIDDGVVNGTSTGVQSDQTGDFLNITSLTVEETDSDGDNDGHAVEINDDNFGTLNADSLTVVSADGNAIDIDPTTTDDIDAVDITELDVDGAAVGVNLASDFAADANIDIADSVLNDISTGVSIGDTADHVNVTSVTLTNVSSTGVDLSGAGTISEQVEVDGLTVDDSDGATGVNVDSAGLPTTITNADVTGVDTGVTTGASTAFDNELTINESTFTQVDEEAILLDFDSQGGQQVAIEHNEFINGSTGLQVENFNAQADNTESYNVHFNVFEENDEGIVVDTDSNANDPIFNVTFNDFEDNENEALNTDDGVNEGSVNANYSWWDNRDSSRIVGPYTPQNAGSQLPIPRRVYSYTRLHTGGQP